MWFVQFLHLLQYILLESGRYLFLSAILYQPLALISVKLIEIAATLNLAIAPIDRYNPHTYQRNAA